MKQILLLFMLFFTREIYSQTDKDVTIALNKFFSRNMYDSQYDGPLAFIRDGRIYLYQEHTLSYWSTSLKDIQGLDKFESTIIINSSKWLDSERTTSNEAEFSIGWRHKKNKEGDQRKIIYINKFTFLYGSEFIPEVIEAIKKLAGKPNGKFNHLMEVANNIPDNEQLIINPSSINGTWKAHGINTLGSFEYAREKENWKLLNTKQQEAIEVLSKFYFIFNKNLMTCELDLGKGTQKYSFEVDETLEIIHLLNNDSEKGSIKLGIKQESVYIKEKWIDEVYLVWDFGIEEGPKLEFKFQN